MQRKFEAEVLAALFGVLIILLDFGDDHTGLTIGNLDTIFGLRLWPVMDVIYPVASIVVFVAYGRSKTSKEWNIDAQTILPLAGYLIVLLLISVDDVSDVLKLGLKLPEAYWIPVMWLYPIISFITFFSFGHANEKTSQLTR